MNEQNVFDKQSYLSNDEKSNYSEDDDDSLGCALNDYNAIFYDAPTIMELRNGSEKTDSKSGTDTCDEDAELVSSGIEEDDEKYEPVDGHFESDIENNLVYLNKDEEEDDEKKINKEFEAYLNEESICDNMTEYSENAREEIRQKLKKLQNFNFQVNDLDALRKLAVGRHGFVTKAFRRKAWPILIESNNNTTTQKSISKEEIKKHKYFGQVTLDVVRTLKRFPPEISDALRAKLQDELIDLICKILVKHNNLHYYQGYHDICLTFVLITGVNESLPLIENLTLTHLTSFMETTMESTVKLLLNIMPLINVKNPQVAEHVQKAELGVMFCLSWLITWYSHVMDNLKIISRLYDLFIASDPMMPIYVGAVIVTNNSEEILSIECDMASLHTVISKYPSKINSVQTLEDYINEAVDLYEQYPPKQLPQLNQKWLEKCKCIEQGRFEQEYNVEKNLRLRGNSKKTTKSKIDEYKSKRMLVQKKSAIMNNSLMVGLTFTVGIAAVAMYAMASANKEPQDLISKVFQMLTY